VIDEQLLHEELTAELVRQGAFGVDVSLLVAAVQNAERRDTPRGHR
jgi:hypothetical protein